MTLEPVAIISWKHSEGIDGLLYSMTTLLLNMFRREYIWKGQEGPPDIDWEKMMIYWVHPLKLDWADLARGDKSAGDFQAIEIINAREISDCFTSDHVRLYMTYNPENNMLICTWPTDHITISHPNLNSTLQPTPHPHQN